jgi:hypothetical protein
MCLHFFWEPRKRNNMSERIGLIAGREAWLREAMSGVWVIAASQETAKLPYFGEGSWCNGQTFPDRQSALDHAEQYRTKLAKGQVWELSTRGQGEVTERKEYSGHWRVGPWWCNADGTMPVVPHRLTRLISEPAPAQEPEPAPAQEPEPAPVVDLMTAPHGSQWLCRDGEIYTHGCWLDGMAAEDKAIGVREGYSQRYFRHGNYYRHSPSDRDIIGPYIEPPKPRTKTVWVEWWESADGKVSGVGRWGSEEDLRGAMARTEGSGHRTIATGKIELVEGEGL